MGAARTTKGSQSGSARNDAAELVRRTAPALAVIWKVSEEALPGRNSSQCSEWIVGDFHEKASPCQAVFLGRPTKRPIADRREAQLAFRLSVFPSYYRKVFGPAIRDSRSPTNGRR